jgi:ribulose kinase
MGKYLGLDLGTDSIGWAIIDNDVNHAINSGVRIYKTGFKNKQFTPFKKTKKRQKSSIALCVIATILLIVSIIDIVNWRFWLNISLTTYISVLTLNLQGNK